MTAILLPLKVFIYFEAHFLVAVADAIRTSLGPRGMDKMVSLFNTFLYQNSIVLAVVIYCDIISLPSCPKGPLYCLIFV